MTVPKAGPWRLDLYFRRRADGADVPLEIETERGPDGMMTGEAVLDPEAIPDLTDGAWDLVARIDGSGWTYEKRLRGYTEDLPARGRLGTYRTEKGNLGIWVGDRRPTVRSPLRRVLARVRKKSTT